MMFILESHFYYVSVAVCHDATTTGSFQVMQPTALCSSPFLLARRQVPRFLATAFWATHGMNFANPSDEAVYYLATFDSKEHLLHGRNRYVLRTMVPKVKAFWSVALYDVTGYFPDGLMKRQVCSFDKDLKYDKGEALY